MTKMKLYPNRVRRAAMDELKDKIRSLTDELKSRNLKSETEKMYIESIGEWNDELKLIRKNKSGSKFYKFTPSDSPLNRSKKKSMHKKTKTNNVSRNALLDRKVNNIPSKQKRS